MVPSKPAGTHPTPQMVTASMVDGVPPSCPPRGRRLGNNGQDSTVSAPASQVEARERASHMRVPLWQCGGQGIGPPRLHPHKSPAQGNNPRAGHHCLRPVEHQAEAAARRICGEAAGREQGPRLVCADQRSASVLQIFRLRRRCASERAEHSRQCGRGPCGPVCPSSILAQQPDSTMVRGLGWQGGPGERQLVAQTSLGRPIAAIRPQPGHVGATRVGRRGIGPHSLRGALRRIQPLGRRAGRGQPTLLRGQPAGGATPGRTG